MPNRNVRTQKQLEALAVGRTLATRTGRTPKYPGEPCAVFSARLTARARVGLDVIATARGVSVSQLIEDIGRGTIELQTASR